MLRLRWGMILSRIRWLGDSPRFIKNTAQNHLGCVFLWIYLDDNDDKCRFFKNVLNALNEVTKNTQDNGLVDKKGGLIVDSVIQYQRNKK